MSAVTIASQVSSMTQTGSEQQNGSAPGSAGKDKETPLPTLQALEFLELLEPEDFNGLLYTDKLVTVSDMGKDLGEFTVTIQRAKRDGERCFLIHANSHGSIDNVPCGTAITTYVTQQLETLEQQHHEYVKLENHPLDRKTSIVKQDGNYTVNKVITQGQDVQKSTSILKAESMQGFMSEGSNLLLQRLLIRKGIPENFQLLAFDSDSTLCPVSYHPLQDRTQVIEGTQINVYGLERIISSHSDPPTTWQAYFNEDGYLTSRVQVGSPVTMKLLILPPIVEPEEIVDKPSFEKKELNFEEDMQLYSKFLDRKEELKNDHAVYMRHHPELKSLLADFIQFLLIRKPEDVVSFAAEYFSSFSTHIPNNPSYLQSSTPSQFPNSRASPKIQHLAQSR